MTVVLGEGAFRYRVVHGFGELPDGLSYAEAAGVAVDSRDRVHAFVRSPHRVIVFDRDGSYLGHWGDGLFTNAHGIHIGPDDAVYCTDSADHSVRIFTPDGRLKMTLGTPGTTPGHMSGQPFCRCTHTALSPRGDIYVSDGYGNARIHKYDPSGRHLTSWGGPGILPGEFNIPHNIWCDDDGWVYVSDRENHRIQVFDGEGRFETQWHGLHRPNAMAMLRGCGCAACVVAEGGPDMPINRNTPNLGPRLSIVGLDGSIIARLGTEMAGHEPGRFIAPHSVAVDSTGAIYVAEVAHIAWDALLPDQPRPHRINSLHKLEPVSEGETASASKEPADTIAAGSKD